MSEQALAETEALAFADRPYTALSGGERQRVQLARVLAQCDADPAVRPFLLLDEPIAGLDLAHQHAALASARRRPQGRGVLAVLHDLTMAAHYADRVAILENGRLSPRAYRYHARPGHVVSGLHYTDPPGRNPGLTAWLSPGPGGGAYLDPELVFKAT